MPASVGPNDIDRSALLVREAEHLESVGALVLDALSKQAEAKLLFVGADYVEKKRAAHDVPEDTELGGVRIVDVLRKGPTTPGEYALMTALMVEGIRAHLDDASRLKRFTRHAEWFALATPYPAFEMIDPVLGDDAGAVWDAVGVDEAQGGTAKDEALVALRRGALARSGHPRAHAKLDEVGHQPAANEDVLEGRLERAPATGFLSLLRLVSGFAALEWLVRGLGFVLGTRRDAFLRIDRGGVNLRSTLHLLGREVRSRDESIAFGSLAAVAHTTRYAVAPMLLGALMFAAGIVIGGLWIFDGVRSGETFLLGVGAVAILIGGGLDYALSTLLPSSQGRVDVEFATLPKRRFRIARVDAVRAQAFVQTLRARAGVGS